MFMQLNSYAQCPIDVNSTNGYSVHINVNITSMIVTPNGCNPGYCLCGYVYNYVVSYNVTFSGLNIPPNLYTLQGVIYDNNGSSFYNLPNTGGTGTTTSANVSTLQSNCNTVTYNYFNPCITVEIKGPGIPDQTISLTCPCTSTAPVELVYFKGDSKNNTAILTWSTAMEKNNDYFILERSDDAVSWNELGKIKGNGTSTSTNYYSYSDINPFPVNYYRLKQVDYNGDYTYSHIANVNLSIITTYVYSNQTDVNIKVISESFTGVNFILYDAFGRVIYNDYVLKTSVEMLHKMQTQGKQLYILKIVQDNYVIGIHKFISE